MMHRDITLASIVGLAHFAGTLQRRATNGYEVTFHGDDHKVDAGGKRCDVVVDGDVRAVGLALHHADPSRLAMLAFEAGIAAERFDAVLRRQRRREQRHRRYDSRRRVAG